jgi:hypothetical protein
LISYIDQHDKSKIPDFIPCRFAFISDARIHGTTVALGLCLQEFAFAENLDSFSKETRTLSGNVVPTWGQDGRLTGYYCLEIDADRSCPLTSSKELATWERIVNQVAQRADFLDEKCFYTFHGIRDVCTQRTVSLEGGALMLKPATTYEIELYHFHPTEGKSNAFLRVQTETPLIRITSNPTLEVNSRYDVKLVRIQTARPTTSETAVLSIFRGDDLKNDRFGKIDFDLRLVVSSVWLRNLLVGVLIGILLAAPQVIAAFSNSQLTVNTQTVITLFSLLAGMSAGMVASFQLPKRL